MHAAITGCADLVPLFVLHGADADHADTDTGRTALMHAAAQGHEDTVAALLHGGASLNLTKVDLPPEGVDKKGKPNKDKEAGYTALFYAARGGHSETIRLLVDADAELDTLSLRGDSALGLACQFGHLRAVQSLLDADARVDLTDNDGRTILMLAARDGHQRVVSELLARPTMAMILNMVHHDGASALSYACRDGYHEVASELIKKGAVTEVADREGRTPLFWAAVNAHPKVVRTLLRAGARLEAGVTGGKDKGLTPLTASKARYDACALDDARSEAVGIWWG